MRHGGEDDFDGRSPRTAFAAVACVEPLGLGSDPRPTRGPGALARAPGRDRLQHLEQGVQLDLHLSHRAVALLDRFRRVGGVAFGLAACMPWPLAPIRYRWSRLLLAGVAAVPIAEIAYLSGYLLPRRHTVGGWLWTTSRWFGDTGTLFALAVLVGVALASGLVRRGSIDQMT
jgi:hypothetical protein